MKWKMSMVPFHLDLTIFLLCSQCLAFHLKSESDMFGRSQMISVNDTAWLPVGVCWWHEVALCLLWMSCCLWYILERGALVLCCVNLPFLPSCLFRLLSFFQHLSLEGQTPWWGKALSGDSDVSFQFIPGGLPFYLLGVCVIQRWGIPSSRCHCWHCYVPLFLLVSYPAPELLWLYQEKVFGKSVASSAIKGIIFLL